MGISTSTLASLLIAGTAIGGSTIAVMANTAPSDINSPSVTQISETDPSAKLPGETTAPLDQNGNLSPVPTPAPTATSPVLPPLNFGGDDDEDDDESGEDDDDEYGQDGYHGDDEGEDDEEDD